MMHYKKYLLLAAVVTWSACADEIPENPTWFGEVQGILVANCTRCHGVPSANNAPAYFRLDRFVAGDGDIPEEAPRPDAFDMASSIVTRAVDYEAARLSPMPPDSSLSERQKEILTRWLANGTPKGSRDNRSPKVELFAPGEPPASVDQELSLQLRSYDEDGDGLIVAVGYRLAGASEAPTILVGDLPGGTADLTVDTGLLESKQRFDIVAILDDGFSDNPDENKTNVVLLGDLLVDHGDRGTAPTVVLLAPNGGSALLGPTEILWTANDPDPGDVLSIDLDLVRVDAAGNDVSTTSLATGLPESPQSFLWDPAGVETEDGSGNAIAYTIRVTASDTGNKNTRSDDSDASFTIVGAGTPTDFTWEGDIKPIMITYCSGCHSQPALNPPLEYFRLDKYDAADTEAPANGDIGVYEQRSLVYQRLVVEGSMPPNAQPQPSAADVAKVKAWIEAGAPFGGGTGDAPPTFTWMKPAPATYELAGGATYTLMWTANDPESLPLVGTISRAQLTGPPPPNMATAKCDASTPGFAEIISTAEFTAVGSVDITLPGPGFFCFKGEVTDDGGQSAAPAYAGPVELQ